MESLPDPAGLTHAQKDEVIHALWDLVTALRKEVVELKTEVASLREVVTETRQVFDLPPVALEVTEHHVHRTRCACGKVHRSEFPSAVAAPVQFTTDPRVPFSNTLAEQSIRMPKVKHKISGGFRTFAGAQAFCTIRSYLATIQKQHFDIFPSLVQAFQGNVPQPRFAR